MKLLFFPDTVLSDEIHLDQGMKALISSVDKTIINFEAAYKGDSPPRSSLGTKLFYDYKYLDFLLENHVTAVSLANNHIMDYGEHGLQYVIKQLTSLGIHCFGAGLNICDAIRPFTIIEDNIQINIFGVASYNTNSIIARRRRPGVPNLSYYDVKKQMLNCLNCCEKEKVHNILFVHCGKEYKKYPEPYVRNLLLKLVNDEQLNIDLIVCCHAHTTQGYVEIKNKFISFGMGNFAIPEKEYEDGKIEYHEEGKYGYGVLAEFDEEGDKFKVINYKIKKGGTSIELLTGEEDCLVNEELKKLSEILDKDNDKYYQFYKTTDSRLIFANKTNNELINQFAMKAQLKTHQLYMQFYRIGGIVKRKITRIIQSH